MTVLAGVPPDLEYLNQVDQVILQQINLVEGQYWLHFRFQMLTHWGRDKMAAVSQTMFSNAFSWMKMFEFRLKFQ